MVLCSTNLVEQKLFVCSNFSVIILLLKDSSIILTKWSTIRIIRPLRDIGVETNIVIYMSHDCQPNILAAIYLIRLPNLAHCCKSLPSSFFWFYYLADFKNVITQEDDMSHKYGLGNVVLKNQRRMKSEKNSNFVWTTKFKKKIVPPFSFS